MSDIFDSEPFLVAPELDEITQLIRMLNNASVSNVSLAVVIGVYDFNGDNLGTVANNPNGEGYCYFPTVTTEWVDIPDDE